MKGIERRKGESAHAGTTDTLKPRNRMNGFVTSPTLHGMARYATRREVAAMLGVNPRTVERLEHDGELVAHLFGRSVRYKVSDVEAWADGRAR